MTLTIVYTYLVLIIYQELTLRIITTLLSQQVYEVGITVILGLRKLR